MAAVSSAIAPSGYTPDRIMLFSRFTAWAIVATLLVFLLNVYLDFWQHWPGAGTVLSDKASALSWFQLGFYPLAIVLTALFVTKTAMWNPRKDNELISAIAAYIARFAFWTVLLVGLADGIISFLRVEELLPGVVGEAMALDLGRNAYRGPVIHLPLIIASLILAAITRTLGFTWLALLVVMAELQIVISRFVFSYEQAFMGDLVRFWYAGLFLFSSAYTLIEEGHVRVDVVFAGLSVRAKGLVNAIGSVFLGLPLCWVVLVIGMSQSSSIISSPLINLEISQSGFGMYVKYLMAGMLGIFAVTMTIQFAGYFLQGMADYFSIPGRSQPDESSSQPSSA